MIADAKRFVLAKRHIIGIAPLQAYVSALAFAPSKSMIRKAYENELPQWLTQPPRMQDDWNNEFLSLEGHSGIVRAVAFSPDNRLLVSGSGDGTVRLWDISTGAARGTLEGHTRPVLAVQFSPDGHLLASGSPDETVRLWGARTGAACGVLEGHPGRIQSLAFSPDALLLASASADMTINLWSTESGASRGTLRGHAGTVLCVTILPDGQTLASASMDGTAKFWNIRTMSLDRTVELGGAGSRMGRSFSRGCVAFSINGHLFAFGSAAGTTLWNTMTGAIMSSFSDCPTRSLTFSPNGQFLVYASNDGVTLRQVKKDESSSMLGGNRASAVSFSPDEKVVAVGLLDHSIRLLNVNLGTAPVVCDCRHPPIQSLHFSADGSLLALGSLGGTVNIVDTKTGAVLGTWNGAEATDYGRTPLTFSPDSTLLAIPSPGEGLTLIKVHAPAASVKIRGHLASKTDLAFSPNGRIIAAASGETVKLWTVETGAEWRTLYGHSKAVHAVTFSPTGDILASGSDDKTIKIWQADRGEERRMIRVGYCTTCLSFSPDGSLLGSYLGYSAVRIWSPLTCELLYTVSDVPGGRWLKFSPNGRVLTTDRGAHRLPLLSPSATAADASADPSYALALMNDWLTCDLENLIWIPPHFRTSEVATSDQVIAFGLGSGEVVVLSFDFSRGRQWEEWEDMTSRSAPDFGTEEPLLDPSKDGAPYPGTEELSPDPPEDNATPAQMRQYRRAWRALKRFLKSPAQNDGES